LKKTMITALNKSWVLGCFFIGLLPCRASELYTVLSQPTSSIVPGQVFELTLEIRRRVEKAPFVMTAMDGPQLEGIELKNLQTEVETQSVGSGTQISYRLQFSLEAKNPGTGKILPMTLEFLGQNGQKENIQLRAFSFEIVPWQKKYEAWIWGASLFPFVAGLFWWLRKRMLAQKAQIRLEQLLISQKKTKIEAEKKALDQMKQLSRHLLDGDYSLYSSELGRIVFDYFKNCRAELAQEKVPEKSPSLCPKFLPAKTRTKYDTWFHLLDQIQYGSTRPDPSETERLLSLGREIIAEHREL